MEKGQVIPLERSVSGKNGETERFEGDDYIAAKKKVTDCLLSYTLLDSYDNFRRHDKPYPFLDSRHILPNSQIRATEQSNQNTALIFLLDSKLPRGLNKHFRLRASNRVTWRNIQRLAPDLELDDYKAEHTLLGSEEAESLLRKLSTLDYALMLDRSNDDGSAESKGNLPIRLSHMHVKVERLTDKAIKDLAVKLGYIERRLFERGEDYVEALESKFFEYFGFSSNASGRKGAAAMAAQLLGQHCPRYSVFVSSQEDCRLTLIDESSHVTQYMLVKLGQVDAAKLKSLSAKPEDFILFQEEDGLPIVLYQVRFRHTAAAVGAGAGRLDRSLTEPWLEIAEECLLTPAAGMRKTLPFDWAGQ